MSILDLHQKHLDGIHSRRCPTWRCGQPLHTEPAPHFDYFDWTDRERHLYCHACGYAYRIEGATIHVVMPYREAAKGGGVIAHEVIAPPHEL